MREEFNSDITFLKGCIFFVVIIFIFCLFGIFDWIKLVIFLTFSFIYAFSVVIKMKKHIEYLHMLYVPNKEEKIDRNFY